MIPPRAQRILAGLCLLFSALSASGNPVRQAPTRPQSTTVPAPKPVKSTTVTVPITVGRLPDYVSLTEFTRELGLEMSWLVPQRRALFKSATRQIEIEAGSRDM